MRRLLLLISLLVASNIGWATCGSGYSFHLALKLVKASGSNQTNFPVKVWTRDYRLATVGNGGQVQNTVSNSLGRTIPADMQFCPDTSGSGTPLKFEGVQYSATLGDLEAWVQVPTYHSASFDTIYLYTNNAAVVTSQEDLTMWSDVNYFVVLHYPDGTTLDTKNSVTASATTIVGTVTAILGNAGGASSTNGSSGNYEKIARTAALEPASAITMETWTLTVGTGGDGNNTIVSKPYRSSGWPSPFMSYRCQQTANGTELETDITTSGSRGFIASSAVIPFFNWNYSVCWYDGANIKNYINGSANGSTAKSGSIDYTGGTTDLDLGTDTQYTAIDFYNGRRDEQRLSSDAKSADWISTTAAVVTPYKSSFIIDESTYAKPQIRQYTSCNGVSGTASCVMPMDVSSGGVMAVMTTCLDTGCSAPCPAMSNDSLGLVYTLRGSSDFTGTLQHYYTCMYTAPITTSGADTITIPTGSQTSTVVFEVKGVTTTSAVYTSASVGSTAPTLTATSPANDSMLIAMTYSGQNGGPSTATTPSGFFQISGPQGVVSSEHFAIVSTAYGIVASGSQSITFNTGLIGEMMILTNAPVAASAVRHRVTNQ
jgi:hypothetical protein